MSDHLENHLRRQAERAHRFFWHRLRWRAVRGYLPRGPFELVDVGAGAGAVQRLMAADRPLGSYCFIEPIESLRAQLRGRLGDQADVFGAEDLRRFGFVTLLDVLEHQPNDRQFMCDLVRKMEPGAMLFVTVPAGPDLWSEWDVLLGHHRRYDKSALRSSVDGLPVAVVELSYLFPELVPMAKVRRRRSRRDVPAAGSAAAEFPDLPVVVDEMLYLVGRASLRLRRHWRTGTSLFMVLRVLETAP